MKIPRLRFQGFAVLRTPLLAVTDFRTDAPTGPADLDARIRSLHLFARTSPACEALEVASSNLRTALEAPFSDGLLKTKVAFSTMRYIERMRGRATPFRLCAGYTMVPTAPVERRAAAAESSVSAPEPPITLCAQAQYQAILRVDVDSVMAVMRARLVDDRDARAAALWVPSREVVLVQDVAKVYRRSHDGSVVFADVTRSKALDALLALSDTGMSFASIAEFLRPFARSETNAIAFVHSVIDAEILVPQAYPSIASADELESIDTVEATFSAESFHTLKRAREQRCQRIGPAVTQLAREVEAMVTRESGTNNAAPVEREVSASASAAATQSCVFDLWKDLKSGAIGAQLMREIPELTAVLWRLSETFEDARLSEFRNYLMLRFESREVPLCEALDPDSGFEFPVAATSGAHRSPLDEWRLKLLSQALASQAREVVLTEATLPAEPPAAEGPSGLAMYGQLRETPAGLSLINPHVLSAPATSFFARATALSPELLDASRAFIAAQAALLPDVDVAQLTYFIPGKSAAFTQFPTLTPFEITLAARPGVPSGQRIDVSDLLVSVVGDSVRVRSRRTGRRLLVLATGAANTDRLDVPSVVRFLTSFSQKRGMSAFHWGGLSRAAFLPRVVFGNHVLSPATWNLDEKDTAPLREGALEARWDAAQRLREVLHWPRHLLYAEHHDHLLPVDLDDVLSVAAWLDIVRKQVTLHEHLCGTDSAVRGPEGRYHNEVLIPFLHEPSRRSDAPESVSRVRDPFNEEDTYDKIPPGDRCLYLSFYGNRSELLSIVTTTLRELTQEALQAGDTTHWFFLPYLDPDPHLRVRFFGEPEALFGRLLPKIRACVDSLLASRVIRHFDVRTYDRETIRYGGPRGMEICERLFWLSSEAALQFHDRFDGDLSCAPDLLVPLVHSQRALLSLAGLTAAAARAQAGQTGMSYNRNQRDPLEPRRAASAHLRSHRAELLHAPSAVELFGQPVAERLRSTFQELEAACGAGEVQVPFARILGDLMHVHSIRLLTVWCEVPDLEAIGYFTLEKVMAARLPTAH